MTSLFERLDQEEAFFRGELATLREKITVAEERLAHLTITREALLSPVVEEYANRDDDVTQKPPGAPADEPAANGPASDSPSADAEVPSSGASSAGPLEWEEAPERMPVLSAGAGRAMKVRDTTPIPAWHDPPQERRGSASVELAAAWHRCGGSEPVRTKPRTDPGNAKIPPDQSDRTGSRELFLS